MFNVYRKGNELKVLHITKTPIAGAPGTLSNIIDRYSSFSSKIYVGNIMSGNKDFGYDYIGRILYENIQKEADNADILHFHNTCPEEWTDINFKGKPFVVQLHSEPAVVGRLNREYEGNYKVITIAQKHALLYKTLPYVPNLIPIFDEEYMPLNKNNDIVHIFYAPSTTGSQDDYTDTCLGKGYEKTLGILEKIGKVYGDRIKITIMTNRSKQDVLMVKRTADIVIDECVTGGYHLASLEGLSMGCTTFACLIPEMIDIIFKITGAKELAWCNSTIEHLENRLKWLIDFRPLLDDIKIESRKWMEKYWNPVVMVRYYIDIYRELLG